MHHSERPFHQSHAYPLQETQPRLTKKEKKALEDEAKKATKFAIQNGGKKPKGGKKNGKNGNGSGSDEENKDVQAQGQNGQTN